MQDTHAIGGGRLFAGVGVGVGVGSGGDRRLRPQHGGNNNHPPALKCPRCDSSNTKFCYFNNYNLSQPRHFCKSCRRYWTKGGVLRNVPVGGGCRKAKRSKTKQAASAVAASSSAEVVPGERNNSNSHSSSESSSLTATTTAAKKKNTPAAAGSSSGEVASGSNPSRNLLNFSDSRYFLNTNGFDQSQPLIDPIGTSEGQIFSDIGNFTNLMTSSNDPAMLSFTTNMPDISGYGLQQSEQGRTADDHNPNPNPNPLVGDDELKMEQINCGYLDQTVHIGFPGLQQNRTSNGGLSGLDWQINGGGDGGGGGGGGGEQGLFDFSGTVDQTYWGQNQWSDHDHSLNFPPLV